jgi:uncharacterized protein YcbK (DUF882 family)
MRYFTLEEFDSPDLPGSGEFMSQDFIDLLEKARERAGVPFVITSGYRTQEHTEYLKSKGYKVSKDSAHRLGLAADIKCTTSAHRYKIVEALLYVGINRIGVGRSFIHADLDNRKHKPIEVIWNY